MTDATAETAPDSAGKANDEKPSFRLPPVLNNPVAVACVTVLLTVTVYGSILGFSFINYDDGTNVFANPHLNPVTPEGLAYLWTHGYYELYTPVTYTIWGLCSYLFRVPTGVYVLDAGNVFVNPVAFHALSLLLHSANTLLVFFLLHRICKKPWPACVGALLFSLHPVQTESVAWVTGTNNLTSGFFGLIALSLYLAAADPNSNTGAARFKYGSATLFFLLALLSKPTAVSVPLVAAALDWGILNRPPARWLRSLLPWVVLSLAIAVITQFTSGTSQKLHLALWARPFIAGDALAYYLSKLIWPVNMSLLNAGRSMYLVKSSWWGYVTWLFPFAVGLLLWHFGRSARLLQTGAIVFVLALLPMLGFVVFYGMADSTVSTRYLYLAMVGVGLAAAWFAGSARIPLLLRGGVCCLYLLFALFQTLKVLPAWKDSAALAQAQVVINSKDDIAQFNSGVFLAEKGNMPESLAHLRAAVRLKPENAAYQYRLGSILEDQGDFARAAVSLREAVRLAPDLSDARINLGGVLLKAGQNREAVEALKEAVKAAPNDFSAHYLLGIALANTRQYPKAESEFRRVLSLAPTMLQARQALGRVLEKQGRQVEAAQIYQGILKTMPEDAEAQQGLTRTQPVVIEP